MSKPRNLAAIVSDFGAAAKRKLANPAATGAPEDQLRNPLETLVKDLAELSGRSRNALGLVGETTLAHLSTRPDFAATLNNALIGFIEVKAPGKGADPRRFKDEHDRRQWAKLKTLPNLIYTDGNSFSLWRDGEIQGAVVRLEGDIESSGAALGAPPSLLALVSDFLGWEPIPPKNAKQLAGVSARLCRLLREEVAEELARHNPGLTDLAGEWRALLFPDASDEQFADGYAQAVTFGLLVARVRNVDLSAGLDAAANELRKSSTLIGTALRLLIDNPEIKHALGTSLGTLTRVLGVVDWATLAKGDADAWLYFYEDFLEVYDNDLRKKTGSYYTPPEVVNAMVRLVDEALRDPALFNRSKGLAAPSVTICDPAVGTGTFLLGVLRRIAEIERADGGEGTVKSAITDAVKRIYGFEMQFGPFAVAQLRLIAEIKALTGKKNGALPAPNLYVTDTLGDPYATETQFSAMVAAIGESRKEANRVKRETPITVVIGNPPYKNQAAGRGGWIENGSNVVTGTVMGDAKRRTTAAMDRWTPPADWRAGAHAHHLKNLYVYFWRWASLKVFGSGWYAATGEKKKRASSAPSPRLRGEGRDEGRVLGVVQDPAPHPNPLPARGRGEGTPSREPLGAPFPASGERGHELRRLAAHDEVVVEAIEADDDDDRNGIVCFITVAGFLNGPGFQKMRDDLRRDCSDIWVVDCSPEGHQPEVNTRIFEGVQQPVCIVLAARMPNKDRNKPARLKFLALPEGHRQRDKFPALKKLSLADAAWTDGPSGWREPFLPERTGDWADFPELGEFFAWSGPGVKTHRTWVISPDVDSLERRWVALQREKDPTKKGMLFHSDPGEGNAAARHINRIVTDDLGAYPTRSMSVAKDKEPLVPPVRYSFRSFDRQWLPPDNRLLSRSRPQLWETHSDRQVFLTAIDRSSPTNGPAISFSGLIPDNDHYHGRGGRVYPLWRDADSTVPNVQPELLATLSATLGLSVSPEDVMAYLAAVMAHPAFTARFQKDLVRPGLRVPLTADARLFEKAAALGREVVWLHTYGERFADPDAGRPASAPRLSPSPRLRGEGRGEGPGLAPSLEPAPHPNPLPARGRGEGTASSKPLMAPFIPKDGAIPGAPEPLPDVMTYDAAKQRLHIGQGYVENVPQAVWDYEVSGMNVLRQWFSYRRRDRSRPIIGDRRKPSPLCDIQPDHWPHEYTSDLLDLLNVLGRLVLLEPAQAALLEEIVSGPLIGREAFVKGQAVESPLPVLTGRGLG